jgi:CubicO group peptidase (beta-lactamase class C family)
MEQSLTPPLLPKLSQIERRDLLRWMAMVPILSVSGPSTAGTIEPTEVIGSSVLDFSPANQAATFRNVDRISATRSIARGRRFWKLEPSPRRLSKLSYEHGGQPSSVDDYMERNRTAGLLILKNGKIALERYAMGNSRTSRWTSFSVAKSVTSTLVGAALHEGKISGLDDQVVRYVPVLKGSSYDGITLRQVMSMTSGVKWDETYSATGDSDIAKLGAVLAASKPGGLMDLMKGLPKAAEPDALFHYSTGETCVEGAVVVGATGKSLSSYLSEKIWKPAGMEADAYWVAESVDGLELGGGNISATLRDYARIGQLILQDGVVGKTRLLPVGWRDLASQPTGAATAFGKLEPGYPLGYGLNWWAFPKDMTAHSQGAFTAQGIFGQFIYVNPTEKLVAVVWSAWPSAWVTESEMETYALLDAAVEALH